MSALYTHRQFEYVLLAPWPDTLQDNICDAWHLFVARCAIGCSVDAQPSRNELLAIIANHHTVFLLLVNMVLSPLLVLTFEGLLPHPSAKSPSPPGSSNGRRGELSGNENRLKMR